MTKLPTDSKNISKEKMPKSYKRALNNYIPTLKYIDDFDEKYSDIYEEYSESWDVPLLVLKKMILFI